MNERLFLHIHAPVFSGGTTFIQSVDADGAGWWRTRRRVWGDVDGEFTLTGPLEELLPHYLGWLGYHVVESTGTLPWAGFIWGLTLAYDGESRRLAYDQVYNDIRARVHTISGYSAHADQQGLIGFVRNMQRLPRQIRLIHGDPQASQVLADHLRALVPDTLLAKPPDA